MTISESQPRATDSVAAELGDILDSTLGNTIKKAFEYHTTHHTDVASRICMIKEIEGINVPLFAYRPAFLAHHHHDAMSWRWLYLIEDGSWIDVQQQTIGNRRKTFAHRLSNELDQTLLLHGLTGHAGEVFVRQLVTEFLLSDRLVSWSPSWDIFVREVKVLSDSSYGTSN